jgi:hypothetical protein
MFIFILVVALIFNVVYFSQRYKSPDYAQLTGILSALTWGLSVVGGLKWSHSVFSSLYWISWFNLFAAAFAAAAVGFA